MQDKTTGILSIERMLLYTLSFVNDILQSMTMDLANGWEFRTPTSKVWTLLTHTPTVAVLVTSLTSTVSQLLMPSVQLAEYSGDWWKTCRAFLAFPVPGNRDS